MGMFAIFSYAEVPYKINWEITLEEYIEWLDFYKSEVSYSTLSNEDFIEIFSPYDNNYLKQELKKINKELNLKNNSEKEKVQKIFKWIYCHTQYGSKCGQGFDYEYDNGLSYISFSWRRTDQWYLGALVEGRVVCAGFSNLFFLLAATNGLEVVSANGTTSGRAHGWNYIKVDGEWFCVDLAGGANNKPVESLNNQRQLKLYGCAYFSPITNKVISYQNTEFNTPFSAGDFEWYLPTADDLKIEYDESKPDLTPPIISVTQACGASVKINFSKVEGAICYKVYRNYYTEGKDYNTPMLGTKLSIIGNSIATISPEKAEQLNYTYYDNSYCYDTYKSWEPVSYLSDETSFNLWEGKKYVYTVVAYGEKKTFDYSYMSNSVIITTNPDRGNLKFFKWDGKLEPHNFGEPVVTKAATCNHTGIKTITCKDCGYTYFADTPSNSSNHNYTVSVVKASTCEEKGQKKKECTVCGNIKYEDIPALGHSWNSGQVISYETCTEDGSKKYTCTTCKKTRTETIPATGHDWTDWTVTREPTCSLVGLKVKECRNCHSDMSEAIPVLPHNYELVSTLYEPTCTDWGKELYKCSECSKMYEKDIKPLGHKYLPSVTYPTRNTLGYTTYTCSNCQEQYIDKYTAPTGKITGIKCLAKTAGAEKITWNGIENVTGYQIQITNAKGNAWTTLKSLKYPTNIYTFTGLKEGSNYKFRVRYWIKDSKGVNHFSAWSNTFVSPTLPKGTSVKQLAAAKRAANVKWYKRAGATGYQIQYGVRSNFKGAKVKAFKSKYLSFRFNGLKSRTRYYFRIRTFKTIGGKNYYSTWSATKSVKIK